MQGVGVVPGGGRNAIVLCTRPQLPLPKAAEIIQQFCTTLQQLKEHKEEAIPEPNYWNGSLSVLHQYRVTYSMVGEVHVVAISMVMDNPFAAGPTVQAAKRMLITICKGNDVSTSKVIKNWGDVFFALNRILWGEDPQADKDQQVINLQRYEEQVGRKRSVANLHFKLPESSLVIVENAKEEFSPSFRIGQPKATKPSSGSICEGYDSKGEPGHTDDEEDNIIDISSPKKTTLLEPSSPGTTENPASDHET